MRHDPPQLPKARDEEPVQLMNLAKENSTLKVVPVADKDDDWNSRYNERDQGSDQVLCKLV